MAASVEIAGRDVGLPAGRRLRLVTACVREYRQGMRGFAKESHLDVWYDRLDASELVDRFCGRLGAKGRILFAEPFAKATRKTSLRAVNKLTERVGGDLRLRSVPPLLVPLRELLDATHLHDEEAYVRELIAAYAASLDEDRRYLFGTYRFVDMARKVVGVRECRHAYLGVSPGRHRARFLRPPALGLESVYRRIDNVRVGSARIHAGLRLVPCPLSRSIRRPRRDRCVPWRRPSI